MKIKMVGDRFEAIPETAAELEQLWLQAAESREEFGQGQMPTVTATRTGRGEFRWEITRPAAEG